LLIHFISRKFINISEWNFVRNAAVMYAAYPSRNDSWPKDSHDYGERVIIVNPPLSDLFLLSRHSYVLIFLTRVCQKPFILE